MTNVPIVNQLKGINTPDLFNATVEFENGAIGVFESCWILPETLPFIADSRMELIFTKGTINMDLSQNLLKIATQKKYFLLKASQSGIPDGPIGYIIAAMGHFVECVLEDKEPIASGDDGLAAVRVSSAIVESAKKRKPVKILHESIV